MAAAKGVIHPNQAARRKSRLMKKVRRRLTALDRACVTGAGD